MTSVPQLPLPIFAGKVCTKCGETKPESEFGKNRPSKDGLFSWCKRCRLRDPQRHDEEVRQKARGLRWCGKCRLWLPVEVFGINRARSDGINGRCKSCQRETARECLQADPEHVRQLKRDRYARVKAADPEAFRERRRMFRKRYRERERAYAQNNRDKARARSARYRQSHHEKIREYQREYQRRYFLSRKDELLERGREWRAANRDTVREYHRGWRQKNKDALKAIFHRRRARMIGNGGHWTAAEWRAIKAAQGYRCLGCRRQEPDITLCFDHIVPVSLGGPNTAANGQGLCRSCNSKKHRRILDLRKGTVNA